MAAKRGGARPGAGRKKGSRDAATVEHKQTLSELARGHTELALNTLASIAKKSSSDAARVAAASALLDRGYGKPAQSVALTDEDGESLIPKIDATDLAKALLSKLAG